MVSILIVVSMLYVVSMVPVVSMVCMVTGPIVFTMCVVSKVFMVSMHGVIGGPWCLQYHRFSDFIPLLECVSFCQELCRSVLLQK